MSMRWRSLSLTDKHKRPVPTADETRVELSWRFRPVAVREIELSSGFSPHDVALSPVYCSVCANNPAFAVMTRVNLDSESSKCCSSKAAHCLSLPAAKN